jgi:hypothetical protein
MPSNYHPHQSNDWVSVFLVPFWKLDSDVSCRRYSRTQMNLICRPKACFEMCASRLTSSCILKFEETTVVTVASDQREARALRRGFFSSPFFCGGSAPSCISVSASRADRALTLFRTADNAFKSALFRVLLSGGRGVRAKFSKIFWRNRKSLSLLERLPHVAPAGESATSVLQSLL